MVKRTKRLRKKIESLRAQEEKHLKKIETELGNKDTTHRYWQKEIEQFRKEEEKTREKLRKLTGKDFKDSRK